jgi:hypothetical protein
MHGSNVPTYLLFRDDNKNVQNLHTRGDNLKFVYATINKNFITFS